jgi:hypothetical protein
VRIIFRVLGRVTIEEMYEGLELEGIVRAVKPYGAFIDVGKQTNAYLQDCKDANVTGLLTAGSTTDGLLHITKMLPMHREHVGAELVVTASEGEKVNRFSTLLYAVSVY